MKNRNNILVVVAFGIAMTALLAMKLDAKGVIGGGSTNNNIYYISTVGQVGQCLLASPNDIFENGCAVSMTGRICHVLLEVNGQAEWAQAFKSPISSPMCGLTLKTDWP